MPTPVVVFTQQGLDALSATDELDPVLVDAADRSTWPDSARAVVAAGESTDGVLDVVRGVPGVEVVQILAAGVEAWLGKLPEGVTLVNGRGAHGGSTAEWAVTVLLALRRGIPGFVRQQDRHEWTEVRSPGLQGAHVLVVGAGDLGEQTRRRLDGFGCTITLVARTARDGVRGVDELPDLLPDADAVVLVLPLTDATRGLVDAAFLARMKDGAASSTAPGDPSSTPTRSSPSCRPGASWPGSTSPTPSPSPPTTRCGTRPACCSPRTSAGTPTARASARGRWPATSCSWSRVESGRRTPSARRTERTHQRRRTTRLVVLRAAAA